ncbi:MAG: ABC transporter ATP-binding protein/permease [Oscillospiraceae bacterium]|nr:ABC transporter ATP-binding protein/permease [Oscillospiraceae bacterium]
MKLKTLFRAFGVSLKTRTVLSLIVSLLGFAAAFLPLLLSLTLRRLTDAAFALFGQGRGQGTGAMKDALFAFTLLASLYLVQTLFRAVQNSFAVRDAQRVRSYILETIIRVKCRVRYKYIESHDNFKEKIRFASDWGGDRVANSVQSVILWLQNLVTFVSILVVLLRANWWIAAALLVTCLPAMWLANKQKDETYYSRNREIKECVQMQYLFNCACTWHTQNDVRFFGLLPYFKKQWIDTWNAFRKLKEALTRKHLTYNIAADLLRSGVYVVILLLAAKGIYDNPAIGLGFFMLVFTLAGQLQDVTTRLFAGAVMFMGDIGYMQDFFDLEKLEQEQGSPPVSIKDKPHGRPSKFWAEPKTSSQENIKAAAVPLKTAEIQFEDVDFTYPDSTRKILKDINVTIKPGEKIAIVGENGSGKTTFINLLCGVYTPDCGRVTVNGQNIFDCLPVLRQSLSVVFQDFGQYEMTIRENIALSDRDKPADDEALDAVTAITGAKEFIHSQPRGYDEIVGSFSEEGNNLSGGQWQRLAVSRAAWRDKACVMILDEPTAALDPIAEADLYRHFAALTGERTTVLISHRLGITSIVDRILVFDDGRIVEDGGHEELLAKNGLYTKLYNAQAQWYKEEAADIS